MTMDAAVASCLAENQNCRKDNTKETGIDLYHLIIEHREGTKHNPEVTEQHG